jgi:hypothetical protein
VDAMVQGVERAAAIQDNGGGGSIPAPHTPSVAHSHNNGGFGRGGSGMGSMPGTVSIPHLKVRPTTPTLACRARHVHHMSRKYSPAQPSFNLNLPASCSPCVRSVPGRD